MRSSPSSTRPINVMHQGASKFKLVVNRGFFPPSDIFRFLLENQHEEVILFFFNFVFGAFCRKTPKQNSFY
ncbi:hypothetical protein AAC387_Pa05g0533 [Persea americana]